MECYQAGFKIPQGCYLKSALTLKGMRIYTRETQLTPSLAGSRSFCSLQLGKDKVASRHIRSWTKILKDSNTELKICSGRWRRRSQKPMLRKRETASPRWACQAAVEQTVHHLQTLYWGGGKQQRWMRALGGWINHLPIPTPQTIRCWEWETRASLPVTPKFKTLFGFKLELWRLNPGQGSGWSWWGEWGRWGDCVFYFSGRRTAS